MRHIAVLLFLSVFIVSLFIIGQLQSCKHEPTGLDKLNTVCFDTEILPIFQNSCAISGCHDNATRKAGFDASSYESIIRDVNPGDPAGSTVYKVLGSAYGNMMPPRSPLSVQSRVLIEVWIAQGAKKTTCGTNTNPPSSTDTICFVQNILPMLTSSCGITNCHDATTHQAGYTLTSYATLTQRTGAIVAGNPGASTIYRSMTASGEDIMPPSGALPATQLATFNKWITNGAQNSDCPLVTCDTATTIKFSTQVWPIIQNNCLGCHNVSNASGGVDLSSYTQVKLYADNLRSGTSVLDGVIRQILGFFAMPPSYKLDKCSIRTVELWIQQGKQNN
jgi:Planctomycete cytochrome C.